MAACTYSFNGNASFAQANGSGFVRASFNSILSVVGAALAVSIFAILAILFGLDVVVSLLAGMVTILALILLVLICKRRESVRPGLSAA